MNERQISSTCNQDPVDAPVEIGESLSRFRSPAEPATKHYEGAVPHAHRIEDSFGSWREMDKVD